MIEILILWNLGKGIAEQARLKGRRGWPWVLLLIFVWFGAEIAGAVAFSIGWMVKTGHEPDSLMLYLPSLGGAFLGGWLVRKFVKGLQPLAPPPLPGSVRTGWRPLPYTAPAATATNVSYYIAQGGKQSGPFTLEQLHEMQRAGTLGAETLYWFQGAADWQPIAKLTALLAAADQRQPSAAGPAQG